MADTRRDLGQLNLELTRQALRELEGRFRALVDASPTGILIVQDQHWVFANALILEVLGFERLEDLCGRSFLDVVHPDSRALVTARLARLDEGLSNQPADMLFRRADGSTLVVEVTSVPITLQGRPAGLVTARDVSEARRVRREREITLNLLRVLNAPGEMHDLAQAVTRYLHHCCPCDSVGLLWRDEDRLRYAEAHDQAGDEQWWAARQCAVVREAATEGGADLALSNACLCGRILRNEGPLSTPCFTSNGSFYTGDTREKVECPAGVTCETLARNGCRVWHYESVALVPLYRRGGVLGVLHLGDRSRHHFSAEWIAFLENIAGQIGIGLAKRQALAALKRSEERLRRLATAVDQSAEVIMIVAPDGTIEYVNPAFERRTGYSGAEAIGQKADIMRSDRNPPGFYESLLETIASGRVWTGRMVNRRKDGSLYTEDSTIAPVKDEHGRIERYVAVKRDVSREVELEAQFRQAQKLESVGRLAAGVAHDLNNLLSPILGYAELLLRDGVAPEGLARPLKEIKHAAERSRDLVQQLLAFARKQVLETHPFDLRRVASGMESLLRPSLRENIHLAFSLAPEACAAMVDKGQVEQVLMNLVVNAQDAMPDGGRLSIEVAPVVLDDEWCAGHPGSAPGRFVCLRVVDSGHGMSPEVRAQVFEPFFTTKGLAGTGLGLSTVYGIVKQHGGSVYVDSEEGQGTTVSVYFPAIGQAVPVGGPSAAQPRSPRGSEAVLVVEDNPQVRRLTTLILQQQGYAVETVTSAREAVDLAAGDSRIDLLLTDVVMPEMNGKELHEKLATLRPGLRALFMSGYTPDVLGHQGVLDEGIAFLRKPFTVGELSTKVREVLDDASGAPS